MITSGSGGVDLIPPSGRAEEVIPAIANLRDMPTPHYMRIDNRLCNGCVLCLRVCPTRAIRVRNHQLAVIEGFCTDCGECLRICPRGAINTVTTGVKTIDKSRTVLVLSPVFYSQFGEGVSPPSINRTLMSMGFLDVYDEFEALEMFYSSMELYLAENRDKPQFPKPLISSVCPVVVRIVAFRFPSLFKHFPPLFRPREIAARIIRNRAGDKYGLEAGEIQILHVTPCSAKMISIEDPILLDHSPLDGAIGINEIYPEVKKQLKMKSGSQDISPDLGLVLAWGKSGGEIATMKDGNFLAVSGIQETVRYLEKIEMGLLDDIDYVEFRTSPNGCIGGALTAVDRYQAKHTIERVILRHGARRNSDHAHIEALYRQGIFFTDKDLDPVKIRSSHLSWSEAIERENRVQQVYERLPRKECGVCGSPDCRTFAEDVVDGRAVIKDCVYMKLEMGL